MILGDNLAKGWPIGLVEFAVLRLETLFKSFYAKDKVVKVGTLKQQLA